MNEQATAAILHCLRRNPGISHTRVSIELVGLPFGGEGHLIDLMVQVAREAALGNRSIEMHLRFPLRLAEGAPRAHLPAEMVGRDTDPRTGLLDHYGRWVEHAILCLRNCAVGVEELCFDRRWIAKSDAPARLRQALATYHSGVVSLIRDIQETAGSMERFVNIDPDIHARFLMVNHRLKNILTIALGVQDLLGRFLGGQGTADSLRDVIHGFLPPLSAADVWTRVTEELCPWAEKARIDFSAMSPLPWDFPDGGPVPAATQVALLHEILLELGFNAVGYAATQVALRHEVLPDGRRLLRIGNDVQGTIDPADVARLGRPGQRLRGVRKRSGSTGMGLSTVAAMLAEAGFPPPRISAWEGPQGRDCFEVCLRFPSE